MEYKFTVGRAVKLQTEEGINILDGNLEYQQIQAEIANCLNKDGEYKNSEKEKEADRLVGLRKMIEFKYACTVMPYFATEKINVDDITADDINNFYDELAANFKTAFIGEGKDTGKQN